jgi:hypothetical protein
MAVEKLDWDELKNEDWDAFLLKNPNWESCSISHSKSFFNYIQYYIYITDRIEHTEFFSERYKEILKWATLNADNGYIEGVVKGRYQK